MKILLMGDASNYHHCLATALARAGHQVTVASNGSRWMDTVRDIDISRHAGKLGGALLWLRLNTVLASQLRGYDVVQLVSPGFAELRPERLRALFDQLRRHNGAVYLTALGNDALYVRSCIAQDSPLRYSEYSVDGASTPFIARHPDIISQWTAPLLTDYTRYVYDNVDGAVCALYEYYQSCLRYLPAHKVAYAGIPVDIAGIDYHPIMPDVQTLHFVVACHNGREAEKGIDLLMPLIKDFVTKHPDRTSFELIQNVPFDEFRRRLDKAHVIVDQLYSYTPATTALMAMAAGKLVISGAEPEYYDFIGEHSLHPIINPDPRHLQTLTEQLTRLIDNTDDISLRSRQGREFVLKHNSSDIVAQRFLDFWVKTAQ